MPAVAKRKPAPKAKPTPAGQKSLAKLFKAKSAPPPKEPLWKGPEVDGITFSLLSRFLVCRERFRCLVVNGLQTQECFHAPLEFGSMWHVCEEQHAAQQVGGPAQVKLWEDALREYCVGLARKHPMDREKIDHWYHVAQAIFPLYVDHWAKNPDVIDRTPLLQEQPFDVHYRLPSGRTVRLRGKWDSVDLIGKDQGAGIYLQENKTKSGIDGLKIVRQLGFDLQTMMYLVALGEDSKTRWGVGKPPPILGVRYNVVRRSAHKTTDSMLKKLEEDRDAGRIGEWFARWKVEVGAADIAKFRQQCLDPILETLCDWWELMTVCKGAKGCGAVRHWRHPFGVYNILDEGGSSDLDEYLTTGSEVGLRRTTNLFPELS